MSLRGRDLAFRVYRLLMSILRIRPRKQKRRGKKDEIEKIPEDSANGVDTYRFHVFFRLRTLRHSQYLEF